jgi:hypothetical protein
MLSPALTKHVGLCHGEVHFAVARHRNGAQRNLDALFHEQIRIARRLDRPNLLPVGGIDHCAWGQCLSFFHVSFTCVVSLVLDKVQRRKAACRLQLQQVWETALSDRGFRDPWSIAPPLGEDDPLGLHLQEGTSAIHGRT